MIKYLSENDSLKIKRFYDKAYGQKHILNNPIHHKWQFKKNPLNKLKNKTVVTFEECDKIYSQMGFIPIELKVDNSIKTALWHVSFFTLPSHRGKGIGTKLVQFTEKQVDYSLVLGGSEGTNKIYEKMGGINFGNLNRYIAILNKSNLEKCLKKKIEEEEVKFETSSLEFYQIKKLDEEYEEFWNKVKKQYPITTNRTKNYLKWRYFDNPLLNYKIFLLKEKKEIKGLLVLRIEDNNSELKAGRIIDILVYKKFEKQLLQEIINFCKNKVDILDFFCTGDFYKNSLLTEKFFNDPNSEQCIPSLFNPIDFNKFGGINLLFKTNHKNETKQTMNDIKKMYFEKGDSDQDRAN